MTEEDIVARLWDKPAQSTEDLLAEITDRKQRLHLSHVVLPKLIKENRVSVVRFTSYAPYLNTTEMLFATEHGRIEIIDNAEKDFCGFQIGHVHDPMGLWDERMKEADKNS